MKPVASLTTLLSSLALLFLPWACTAQPRPQAERAWFEKSLVGLEVGPTGAQFGSSPKDTGYAAAFDGTAIARATKDSGAAYLVMWARDGEWVYYRSKFQPRPPGLADRDPLREAVDEGRKLGLPVIAYCQVQYPQHDLREHPEWRAVDPTGKSIDGRVCFRSGYLDHVKKLADEQLAYGVAGFHFDMIDQGFGPPHSCWCPTCRKQFETEHGRPMPKGMTWDDDWERMLAFRYASSANFEKELTAHVRKVNPKASVDFNYHGTPPFSWEVGQRPGQHAAHGDFVTGETGAWGFSALGVGLNAEFYRTVSAGRPYQIAMQRGVRMYHDQTTRPLPDMRWELLTLLAHGGFVTMVDKTGFDGRLDPTAYERFAALFREVESKREHFGHTPVAEVGLYFSGRTRDWYGRDKPADYFQAFQGAHKAVVYEHIPWGILTDETISPEALKKFPVVLVPNVAVLSESEVTAFTKYVEGGGKLIVTGLTGTRGWRGESQAKSSLEKLIGGRFVKPLDSTDNWVKFPLTAKLTATERPILARGPAVVYEPTTATAVGELIRPHRTTLHAEGRYNADWPLSPDATVGPAVLLNKLGDGTVLTFAASPDWATASDHHTPEVRKLLAAAVRLLNTNPRVTITAPATVQAVVTDDPATRTLRVHLLGYNAPPQTTPAKDRPFVLPVPIEDEPMYRATIAVLGLKSATAFHKTTGLKQNGDSLTLIVENVHEVIVCRY